MSLEKLKYPIGKFVVNKSINQSMIDEWIVDLSTFPERLKNETFDLTDKELDTPYRINGWTIRQVIHHCADSHMNSFIRFKLALTEDNPVIKPYFEERWAELIDSKQMPIASSLNIIEGIHERWVLLLMNLTSIDLKKTFIHPESGKNFYLDEIIGMYAWHSNHHLAQILECKKTFSNENL